MSDNSNSEILDLDALVPQTAKIKFGGKEIDVQPPKTADLLKLGSLGQKVQKFDDFTDEQTEEAITSLTGLIKKIIPELADAELNTQQILGLVKLISDMATPPDVKELDKRGITPNTGGAGDPKAA
jgi:hypothetical protein